MSKGAGETVRVLQGGDPGKRVRIIRRADGMFAIEGERWYREESDDEGFPLFEGWIPIVGRRSTGFYATAEIAEQEAIAKFSWLRSS